MSAKFTAPVTIADLARQGRLMLVWCRCGHRAELDPAKLRVRPSTPLPGFENRCRCTGCGAKNTAVDHPIMAVMDPRKAGQDVRYPVA